MSTQETHSQTQCLSQSQTQSHTDFLVNIATENASLKVQIKQEFDNSCAIVHQINKSIREIDSCKRDLIKLSEIRNAKVSELKRLEADLDNSHSSRMRVKNNIDYLEKQEKQILSEEEQKKVTRNSVVEAYEKMIRNQKEINKCHHLMLKTNEMQNLLENYEIQLAVLKQYINGWRKKENQMSDLNTKRLNSVVVDVADMFLKKRMQFKKKIVLTDLLSKQKIQLQKVNESKQIVTGETTVFQKPIAPIHCNLSRINSARLSKSIPIAPSFQFPSDASSVVEPRDLMKHFQQVSVFKTSLTGNPFVFPSKLSRPFSPRTVTGKIRQKLPFNRLLKSPSANRQLCQSPSVRSAADKENQGDESYEYNDILEANDISAANESAARTCFPATEINPVENDVNFSNDEINSHTPCNEVVAINSGKNTAPVTGISSADLANGVNSIAINNNRAPSLCRSNCSTPVSVKSVGSQKGKSKFSRSCTSALKSPRPVDSLRGFVRFSPINKIQQSPKKSFQQNIGSARSWKLYRTPDILLKKVKEKQLNENRSSCLLTPKPVKRMDLTSAVNNSKTKPKKLNFEATVDAFPAAEDMKAKMKPNKKYDNFQNMNINSEDEKDNNPKKVVEKLAPNDAKKQRNSLQSNFGEVAISEQNHSKYFLGVDQPYDCSNAGIICENVTSENLLSNNVNISFGSGENVTKSNSITSNDGSSHFSSNIMQESGENFSSPISNFVMPFSSPTEGGVFGIDNSSENQVFSLSGGLTSKDGNVNNSGFLFNIAEDMSKQTFSLF